MEQPLNGSGIITDAGGNPVSTGLIFRGQEPDRTFEIYVMLQVDTFRLAVQSANKGNGQPKHNIIEMVTGLKIRERNIEQAVMPALNQTEYPIYSLRTKLTPKEKIAAAYFAKHNRIRFALNEFQMWAFIGYDPDPDYMKSVVAQLKAPEQPPGEQPAGTEGPGQ